MKKFLLSLAHFGLLAANAFVAIKYPQFAPVLAPVLAAGNAALPTPLTKKQPGDPIVLPKE